MARPKRAAPVSRSQVEEIFDRISAFPVRWSRPSRHGLPDGLPDTGRGYATGVNKDGSLRIICGETGGVRSIQTEHVKVQTRVETKRSIRNVWQPWTDETTEKLNAWAARRSEAPVEETA